MNKQISLRHYIKEQPAGVVKDKQPKRFIWSMLLTLMALVGLFVSNTSFAAPNDLPIIVGNNGGTSYSLPIQTLIFLTALSFIPAIVLMMTAFTRIVIVLSLLRQAIGVPAAPPNQVIIGLSLFLTFFVMSPTIDKIYTTAYKPYQEQKISFDKAIQNGAIPLREFMLKQTHKSDAQMFSKLAKLPPETKPEEIPMSVLIPAFVTSELKTAFQIGFLIMIPFLVIDMIVASVLMSMGMMMLSPVIVSLPFKIMIFVLVDGWNLVIGTLAESFMK